MPAYEAPCAEQCDAPRTPSLGTSLSSSEVSGTSSPEPQNLRPSPLFRALAMPPPDPEQPPGQEELERRVPGYRRIVIPRELTLIELLKQSSGASTDEEVLQIREAKLRVVAERVGLRRLHVLAPCLRSLTLDGSAISSLRDLGSGLVHLKILSVSRCGLTCLDGVWGLGSLRELHAAGNRLQDLQPLAALRKLHTLNLAGNPISEINRLWTLSVCTSLRRLTLQGTPASDEPDYRTRVVMSLPMLIHLDGLPLLTDTEDEIENMFDEASSGSECEEEELPLSKPEPPQLPDKLAPGTSHESIAENPESDVGGPENFDTANNLPKIQHCRRPATTEGAGLRPLRPNIPPRPKTAQERPTVDAPTRLQILNTLMDEEWRCSGSKLTSAGTVCGNLAQALRRPASARRCTQAD
ncbi:leucine-rich repeat-containing protein 56 [Hyposmocoma kahamanoa]|uniref:leucine-rich repeat-containing protein 56 n=1 Tax=Hyposmocoma kahamanoa TaxID=1477025 RepID=UPI000E6D848A|nr:leucine-rich repeat-containing protein 56 [Hyposmocoma kahamanoa]